MSAEPERAQKLHSEALVVDAHNDWILLLERGRTAGQKDGLGGRFLPQFRQGGIDAQVTPIYIDEPFLPEAALRRTLLLIQHLREEVEAHADEVTICLTGAEIDETVRAGRLALVLALEGSHAIGADVELFPVMFELGVRMASFTWMGNTVLAGGSGDGDPGTGLSKKGIEALGVLEELGIVMDVSHLSTQSLEEVLQRAKRPLVASHSSARALREHHRNIQDDHLKGIAALGGVIGITSVPSFTHDSDHSLDRVADHVLHVAETAGIDHVGIGTDFMKEYVDEEFAGYPNVVFAGENLRETIAGWATADQMPAFTAALLDRGLSTDDVKKVLGENFMRVFREVMGKGG